MDAASCSAAPPSLVLPSHPHATAGSRARSFTALTLPPPEASPPTSTPS